MAEGDIPETSRVEWIVDNQTLAVGIAFLVLSLYVAPVFLAGISWWNTSGFQEDSTMLSWFAAFMNSADSTLNSFHKILLPILSTLAVVSFKGRPTQGMLALGAFILFAFVVTLSVAVVFDMKSTTDALTGLSTEVNLPLTKAFFTRIQESLMMYLMLLLGIGLSNKA